MVWQELIFGMITMAYDWQAQAKMKNVKTEKIVDAFMIFFDFSRCNVYFISEALPL